MRRWPGKSLSENKHIPVMAAEVVEHLKGCPSGIFIDATVGGGGHMAIVHEAYQNHFSYFGFDLDERVIENTKEYFSRIGLASELVKANFANAANYLQTKRIGKISAMLFDLGLNSIQVDDPEKGFSYLTEGPLGLSFNGTNKYAAAELISSVSEKELMDILRMYGEEPKARSLAKAIKAFDGELRTTGQLAAIIRETVGDWHFVKTSARIFQALRIKVNNELGNIEKSLESILPMLDMGGRIIVISYHSLEDRLVKKIFRKYSGKCVCPPGLPACRCGKRSLVKAITAKPLKPTAEEIRDNSRARSAKMRVVERIAF
jgi:16S rRNA (cytosine1402-N4)-methyltransferase